MNWAYVGDWIFEHRCFERQRYGSCNCRRKHGKAVVNPCQIGTEMMESAIALDAGLPASHTPEQIAKWVHSRMCAGGKAGTCNHRGCINAQPVYEFIISHQKKAAA